MKLFGSIKELVSAVFRKDTYEITLRPNQSTTYTAARDVQLPAKDGNAVLVSSGDIVNADINASAAIAYSKLALSNSIVNADISATAAVAYSKLNLSGSIVNADIASGAAIADTKLATISTAGKVSNSATTATSSNTASAIVARDASGNFSAGTITATLSGNATNVSGTVAIANGGTGQTTQQAALTALAGTQASGQYLRSNGTNTLLSAIQAADVPTLNQNTTGTAANVTGIVAPANGGTGQNFSAASGVIKASAGTFSAGSVSLTADVSGTLPVANGGTGITSLGSGVATFLGTPSSANLASAVTDETGSGSLVFGTSPTLSSPQVNSSLVVQRIATPSNPSAGFDKIYTKSDGLLYKLDSSGNEVAVGSGASGSGEINAVLNPSAATDTTGWAAGTSHTVTKDSSNSPLNGIVSTSLAIASSAAVALGSQTSTSGVYDAITLPSGLQNRKLKVEFFFTTPASSAGTWAVAVYQGSTKLALSTDSAGDTILPAGVTGGKFTAYFDSSSSSGYSLNLVQRTRTGANTLYITNVIVGPGIQPQGAVVGEWTSYSPTLESGVNFGASGSSAWFYRRSGSSLELRARVTLSGAGISINGTSGYFTFTLPTSPSLTINTTQDASNQRFGTVQFFDATNNRILGYVSQNSSATNTLAVSVASTASTGLAALLTTALAPSGSVFWINATVPIAEWAGSGTVQLAQNDVEYASNGNATNTASDTATFVYGPGGSLVPNGGTGTSYVRGVKFQSPVQATDRLFVEVNDGNGWAPIETRLGGFSTQNATSYGVRLQAVSGDATRYNVTFMSGGYESGGSASYGVNGSPWSGISTYLWRIRKSSAGAAVGFGIVSGSSAGLLPASNSNLDDATATRLGLKQYLHGTTYNGGNAPTVTCTLTGFIVERAAFIPYQMQDGTWRVKVSIRATFTSATITIAELIINGISFNTTTQGGSGFWGGVTTPARCYVNSATSIKVDSSSVTTNAVVSVGDFELAAKPTWAY